MAGFKMVSLFTGAGGLDYGFEAAGFETSVAVEMDKDCCATIRQNRLWPVIEDDIHKTPISKILDTAGLRAGDVDLLIGGPPCQPFSKAGYWVSGDTKRLNDPRANTLDAYMQCVKGILPRAFVLENVHGINYSGKEEGFHLLERLTKEINEEHGTQYHLSWKVINTATYGVPQLRKRFFLVADREGKIFEFPKETHAALISDDAQQGILNLDNTDPFVTAWDAIGGLEVSKDDLRVKGQWADLLPSIPEGESYLWHTNRKGGLPLFGWRTRYWSFLLKLAKDKPSWTIQAQPGPAIGPFHWENRLLSIKEMASIQTFPKDIEIVGGRISAQRQLGNAVPSLISEIIGRAILEQFFGLSISEPLKLFVQLKRPIPAPEPVQPVPHKYLHLVGEHPDHPGEGKKRELASQYLASPAI